MHLHLNKSRIEDLISQHSERFLDNSLVVEVSTGGVFKCMRLRTNVFIPKGDELMTQSSINPDDAQMMRQYSAPIGLLGLITAELKRKCNKHIEEMIANPMYAEQVTAGYSTNLPLQLLNTICVYAAAIQKKGRVGLPFISHSTLY